MIFLYPGYSNCRNDVLYVIKTNNETEAIEKAEIGDTVSKKHLKNLRR